MLFATETRVLIKRTPDFEFTTQTQINGRAVRTAQVQARQKRRQIMGIQTRNGYTTADVRL